MKAAFAAALLCLASASSWATNVYVIGVGRSEAQIVVNGTKTYKLKPGQSSPEGVTLQEIRGNAAVLEFDGRQLAMSLGQSTVAQTQLKADSQGQFFVTAFINGAPMRALIDTGASSVSLNRDDALRLGINLAGGQPMLASTANGTVRGTRVNIPRVQVGDIVLTNVEGNVLEGGVKQLSVALIGMSFLKQVELRRAGDTLILSRPTY